MSDETTQIEADVPETFVDVNNVIQLVPPGMKLVRDEAPAIPSASESTPQPQGLKLQKRCYEDEPSTLFTYDAIVRFIDGRSFNVDLLSDAEFDAYNSESQRIGNALRTAEAGTVNELFGQRRALIDGLIRSHVKGENGIASESERRAKMIFTDKVDLVEGIAAKSKFGHTDADFLGQP